uniref:Uncharacterized protein n=1 Tax=Arundo donax TaxID=35708 RepID=A0A0A9CIY9_ARUDO
MVHRTWSELELCGFLCHRLLPFPEQLLPEVPNPQVAHRNGGADNNDPGDPHPPRDDVDSLPGDVERAHLEEEERAGDAPNERVQHVEGRRHGGVHACGGRGLVPPDPGERPDVLEQAGDLGEHEEDEKREGAVADEVAAGEEDEERGEVVRDEEVVPGQEGEVVEQVHGEVGDAVVEDVRLERRVGRGEGPGLRGQREDGAGGGERGGGAVEERDEAAGAVQSLPRRPPLEQSVAEAVDSGVHGEKRRVQPPLLGDQGGQQLHGPGPGSREIQKEPAAGEGRGARRISVGSRRIGAAWQGGD